MIHPHNSPNADAVVATVARGPIGLTRHNLPGDVTISYLHDGDEDRRGTCQWRVVAPDAASLRLAVAQLTASLDRTGVTYDEAHLGETLGHFQDHGPWPAPATAAG
jgi:hypothetical protein